MVGGRAILKLLKNKNMPATFFNAKKSPVKCSEPVFVGCVRAGNQHTLYFRNWQNTQISIDNGTNWISPTPVINGDLAYFDVEIFLTDAELAANKKIKVLARNSCQDACCSAEVTIPLNCIEE